MKLKAVFDKLSDEKGEVESEALMKQLGKLHAVNTLATLIMFLASGVSCYFAVDNGNVGLIIISTMFCVSAGLKLL